jgi:hypothetical protein
MQVTIIPTPIQKLTSKKKEQMDAMMSRAANRCGFSFINFVRRDILFNLYKWDGI